MRGTRAVVCMLGPLRSAAVPVRLLFAHAGKGGHGRLGAHSVRRAGARRAVLRSLRSCSSVLHGVAVCVARRAALQRVDVATQRDVLQPAAPCCNRRATTRPSPSSVASATRRAARPRICAKRRRLGSDRPRCALRVVVCCKMLRLRATMQPVSAALQHGVLCCIPAARRRQLHRDRLGAAPLPYLHRGWVRSGCCCNTRKPGGAILRCVAMCLMSYAANMGCCIADTPVLRRRVLCGGDSLEGGRRSARAACGAPLRRPKGML